MKKTRLVLLPLLICIVILNLGCAGRQNAKIIRPIMNFRYDDWTAEERRQEVAVRTIRVAPDSSHHLIRIDVNGREYPHVHDTHDLAVVVLSGKGAIHFAGRSVALQAGDVIDIPRGAHHWAENTGAEACEVYAIFTPAFDGKDRRHVEME